MRLDSTGPAPIGKWPPASPELAGLKRGDLTNPIPPSCLAQIPDGIGDETGKVHVCALYAGHDYVPNDHTGTFWHRCACGVKFAEVESAQPATT